MPTTHYIDPVNGSPLNNGTSSATPVACLFFTATCTGSISGTTLTISGGISGVISPGRRVTGTGVTANTVCTAQLTGTPGGAGTYQVSISQNVSSTTLTFDNPNISSVSGDTYLLKAGTTLDTSYDASNGLVLGNNVTVGIYGGAANATISSTTGVAWSHANRNGNSVSNINMLTTGTAKTALNLFNAFGSTFTSCSMIGTASGANHAVTATNVKPTPGSATVTGLHFINCTFMNTVNTGVSAGFFGNTAVASTTYYDILFDGCVFLNDNGYGVVLKSGDGVANAFHDSPIIRNCLFDGMAKSAIIITNAAAANDTTYGGDFTRYCKNPRIYKNVIRNCLGPAMCVTAQGGLIDYNEVCNNNIGNLTGTGGVQLCGAQGVVVEYNTVYQNKSGGFAYDGAGIYLDLIVGGAVYGCNQCVVRKNVSWGHRAAHSADNTGGTISSPGIKLYHSDHNEVYGNVCYDNLIGICVDNFSFNNKVYNNTLINNTEIGVAMGWQIGAVNDIRNNIIVGSAVDIGAPVFGDRSTTGNLTLSATGSPMPASGPGSVITISSSQNDFATNNVNYAIREVSGPGIAIIVIKNSNSSVTAYVMSAFSTTSLSNGAWKLSYGTAQTGINDYNMAFNSSRSNGGVGAAAVFANLTAGAHDISAVDPLLDQFYVPRAASLAAAAQYIKPMTDFYGKEFSKTPTMGAVQLQVARSMVASRGSGARAIAA